MDKLIEKYLNKIIGIRRHLHMYPELSRNEIKTSEYIRGLLFTENISIDDSYTGTGFSALIKGRDRSKTLALRTDMDALPVNESGSELCAFISKNNGIMHACGHDIHMACIIGAGIILNNLKDKLNGNIKLIFQPDEEDEGGALPMINEGVLKKPDVDCIIGLHCWPGIKSGTIEVVPGPMMACPDEFYVTLTGNGGHGSAPHQTHDIINTAAQIITGFQTIISRYKDPLEPAVISVCNISGGTAVNIIPSQVRFSGTVRVFNPELRKMIPVFMENTVKHISELNGGKYEFNYIYRYPPVINNKEVTNLLRLSAEKVLSSKNVCVSDKPSMAGEDFAYYLERVPGTMFRLGISNENKITQNPLHSPDFTADEDCIRTGIKVLVSFALDYLE